MRRPLVVSLTAVLLSSTLLTTSVTAKAASPAILRSAAVALPVAPPVAAPVLASGITPVMAPKGLRRPALTILDTYAFQYVSASGEPGRWDPCTPISWRLYKPGAPKGVLALLKRDFKKVSAASGLTFVYKGYAPRSAVRAEQPGITIAFMPRSSMLAVDGVPNASGSASLSGIETPSGRVVLTGATVTFLRSRFSPRKKVSVWEPLILHELAHAVGLDHVDDASQVMYPYERSFREYQPGDLAGLKRLGIEAGCNPIVDPQLS